MCGSEVGQRPEQLKSYAICVLRLAEQSRLNCRGVTSEAEAEFDDWAGDEVYLFRGQR